MTNAELKQLLLEEIDFCRNQLEDCDFYDRDYYIGAIHMLLDVIRKVKRAEGVE